MSKTTNKALSFAVGAAIGVAIFVVGWFGSKHYYSCHSGSTQHECNKGGMATGNQNAQENASVKITPATAAFTKVNGGDGASAFDIKLQKLELAFDDQAQCYWLTLALDKMPKFRLLSDSERPYRLQLYGASAISDRLDMAAVTKRPESPIEHLQWHNQLGHSDSGAEHSSTNGGELVVQLKPGYQLAGVRTQAAPAVGECVKLKLQIVKLLANDGVSAADDAGLSEGSANSNVRSWRRGELVVDGENYQAASSSLVTISNQQSPNNGQQTESPTVPPSASRQGDGSFVVRRAKTYNSSDDRSAAAMQKVDELLERNDLMGAISELRVMLRDFGARQDVVSMLSALLLETGQVKDADEVVELGLRKMPTSSVFNELKAKTLIAKGAHRKAREHLSRFVALDDLRQAELGFLALLGMVDYQLGQFEEGVLIYHELTHREPNKAAWWLGLGMSLEGFGRPKAAREAYQYGLKLEDIPLNVRDTLLERLQQVEDKK